jgi:hypothetical protein
MKAFTLTEFLVIFSIIVIIIGMGFPVFKALRPDLELSGDVRDLAGNLRLASRMAVTSQDFYGILFTEEKYQLVLFGEEGEILEVLKEEEFNQGVKLKAVNFPDNRVIFNSYGSVNEGGSVSIENSKGESKNIFVSSAGFVKIEN